ncbi:hypothetical protein BJV82DRAFT_613895 [Fennellomyces sp. T-0311]|nr:hypothetical protein BJV82DRAFT_613895 [Fennellomyces sp. T-0311]
MKFSIAFALLGLATFASVNAAPGTIPSHHLQERQCLPASCVASGCCSGDCGYWCRQCKVDYTC